MAERAEALAAKFEQANNAVISMVEQVSDDQWKANCEEEGWPVGVTAHHIGSGYTPITGLIQALASGADFPALTTEQIDQGNADHASNFA